VKTTKTLHPAVVALALLLPLVACGSKIPSLLEQANQVAAALQGLEADPVALVSNKASAEVRENVAELFAPGSKVSPDVESWAPDGPDRGTMVVTVEPPDQGPRTIIVVVIIEDSDWKIFDIVPEEPPTPPSDSPEAEALPTDDPDEDLVALATSALERAGVPGLGTDFYVDRVLVDSDGWVMVSVIGTTAHSQSHMSTFRRLDSGELEWVESGSSFDEGMEGPPGFVSRVLDAQQWG